MALTLTATVKEVVEKVKAILKPYDLQVDSVRYFEACARSERIASKFIVKHRVFFVGGSAKLPSPKMPQG
ncbi:hypothetical protein BC936DRAFT_144555 [Jimgerdemannia flammicorona]|uniref:Uncharacterized protein n=2 Tax=Jimgerdemannia flammicorona TaxID=994334 RepID=A0A433Q4B8_9FUNG|nr:hypothetical protein BC936DRAFT_144555 [Jimgerdemannia flammicorona]RUS24582.1 hypothetical protein BC938DRAFT_473367 [Jimgerdemannia flammicorona]